MARYPVIQDPVPWNVPTELGTLVTVAGREVYAVMSEDPVVGNIQLGQAGFEGVYPYALIPTDDLEGLSLYGATLTSGADSYVVRNVHAKRNINLTRLDLDAR